MNEPFRLRTKIRRNIPWFLIKLGVAKKGFDCKSKGGSHEWYKSNDSTLGCYHCIQTKDIVQNENRVKLIKYNSQLTESEKGFLWEGFGRVFMGHPLILI